MKMLLVTLLIMPTLATADVVYAWENLAGPPLSGQIEFNDATWAAGDLFYNTYYPALFGENAPILRLDMTSGGAAVDWPADAGCNDDACALGAFDLGLGRDNLGHLYGPPNMLVGSMYFADSDAAFFMQSIDDDGAWRVDELGSTGRWVLMASAVPEPSIWLLLLTGLVMLFIQRHRMTR